MGVERPTTEQRESSVAEREGGEVEMAPNIAPGNVHQEGALDEEIVPNSQGDLLTEDESESKSIGGYADDEEQGAEPGAEVNRPITRRFASKIASKLWRSNYLNAARPCDRDPIDV